MQSGPKPFRPPQAADFERAGVPRAAAAELMMKLNPAWEPACDWQYATTKQMLEDPEFDPAQVLRAGTPHDQALVRELAFRTIEAQHPALTRIGSATAATVVTGLVVWMTAWEMTPERWLMAGGIYAAVLFAARVICEKRSQIC